MSELRKKLATLVLCGLVLSGCASTVTKPAADATVANGESGARAPVAHLTPEELKDSSVDIVYELGRTERRLSAEKTDYQVTGRYLHDHDVLSEGEIDPAKYDEFLQKAFEFVQVARRVPSSDETHCHAPFTVSVRIQKDIKVSTGCRSADEGALSHLVKQGEFLIYSKK